MKIKLLIDLPINKKHGAFKGKIFDCIKMDPHKYKNRDSEKYWFVGIDGTKCAAIPHEIEILEDDNEDQNK